jgi:hypothetical protein
MKYGITLEQYNMLLEEQNGACAICGTKSDSYLSVDHDHKTKIVRGLLCQSCNIALGLLHDDIGLGERAIEYLSRRRIMV